MHENKKVDYFLHGLIHKRGKVFFTFIQKVINKTPNTLDVTYFNSFCAVLESC